MRILGVLALLLYSCICIASDDLYSTCYLSKDFGNIVHRVLSVRPLGKQCHDLCANQCNVFSRKIDNIELNDDIMVNCQVSCRGGNIFTSTIREPSQDADAFMGLKRSVQSFSTQSACNLRASDDSNPYNVSYNAALSVDHNDTIRVKLISPISSTDANEVFLCGWNIQYLAPKIDSLIPNVWSDNPNLWTIRDSSISTWNARNHIFTNTNINIRDGDFVSIIFGGQYFSVPPAHYAQDYNLRIKKPDVQFLPYGNSWIYNDSDYYLLEGNNIVKIGPGISADDAKQQNANLIFGLDGEHFGVMTRMGGGINFGSNSSASNGYVTVDAIDNYYRYSGTLRGFSSNFTRLGIAHDRANSPPILPFFTTSPWDKSLGGYYVKIERQGCRYQDGEMLYYGIGKQDLSTDPKNPKYLPPTQWTKISKEALRDFAKLNISEKGLLYFAISPAPPEGNFLNCLVNDIDCIMNEDMINAMFSPIQSYGQYTVLIERDDSMTASMPIISSMVRMLRGYLFGEDGNAGVVQEVFLSMLSTSGLITAVRALMVFYIAFTGLSFILGIARLTQQEAVVRLVKVGVLVTLISPDSWNFFSNTFFKLITDGGLDLIVRIVSAANKTPEEMALLYEDPILVFEDFNEPFNILFGRVTFLKIFALIASTWAGVVVAIVVVFASVIYLICIAKAALLYMISMIGIAVLLTMAPIFISFLLFRYTKQMFDAWWKQLFSLMLQPVLVYTFIFVMNLLLLLCLKTILGFSICYGCGLSINLSSIGSFCLFNFYTMVSSMHMPDSGFAILMSVISTALIFMILAQAMYAFTEWAARLAHMMATSQFNGDIAGAVGEAVNQSIQLVGGVTGLGLDRDIISGSQDLKMWTGKVRGFFRRR